MRQVVSRVYAVRTDRLNDPEIAFSTLKGAVDYLNAFGIGEDMRRYLIIEMPIFEGFTPIYGIEVSDG